MRGLDEHSSRPMLLRWHTPLISPMHHCNGPHTCVAPLGFFLLSGVSCFLTAMCRRHVCHRSYRRHVITASRPPESDEQEGIGRFGKRYVQVRSLCAVNTHTMRTIKLILQRPGISVAKTAILVGGPDWPTSVISGVMGLNIIQATAHTAVILLTHCAVLACRTAQCSHATLHNAPMPHCTILPCHTLTQLSPYASHTHAVCFIFGTLLEQMLIGSIPIVIPDCLFLFWELSSSRCSLDRSRSSC